jgi:5-methylcytosine-specific restriction endonuclease McrA
MIKKALGYTVKSPAVKILADWKKRLRSVCKPCWELKYCPYGPLVEEFPLPPLTRKEAQEHLQYLRSCLQSGQFGEGRKLDNKRREKFKEDIRFFESQSYPESIPRVVEDAACRVFGHLCPVFFVGEPLTETQNRRGHSRTIPRDVMLKVVRRDGQICQECHEPIPDDQVEFDHIIPFSKGGTATPDNLRLLHRDCNRQKSDALDELLSPYPIMHLVELQSKNKKKAKQG